MMTTTDQDRRIQDRSIELGATTVLVGDVGPASTNAIVASYQDDAGQELGVERIREDGTTTGPERWLAYVRRWRQYAGRMTTTAIALLTIAAMVAAAPAAAALEPIPNPTPAIVYGDATPCAGQGETCTGPGQPIYTSGNTLDRRARLHEYGHHFDYLLGEDAAAAGVRARFARITGNQARPWRTSPNSPHEQFAETYRACASRGPATIEPGRRYWIGYRTRPLNGAQLRAACGLICRAGRARPGRYLQPAAPVWCEVTR